MSLVGTIQSLFQDKERTKPIFPVTKVKAVSDDNGVGLDALMQGLMYSGVGNAELATAPLDADTLGGRPASEFATQNYVAAEIAKAQLEGEDIDLSAFATKYDIDTAIDAIDYPVDSVNGKTGAVTLSASDVGAFPATGGTATGDIKSTGKVYAGDNVYMYTNNEGGNIVVVPPSDNTHTNQWEMDSYNGSQFRIFANRKSTNADGSGYVFPLTLYTDGSFKAGNAEKTREHLGITPANIGAAPAGYGWGEETAIKLVSDCNDAILTGLYKVTANAANSPINASSFMKVESYGAGAKVQTFTTNGSVTPGYATRIKTGNTWGEWEYINPPMALGVEYRTTERCEGKPVYAKRISYTIISNVDSTIGVQDIWFKHDIDNFGFIVRAFGRKDNHPFPYCGASAYGGTEIHAVDSTKVFLRVRESILPAGDLYFDLYYTKA